MAHRPGDRLSRAEAGTVPDEPEPDISVVIITRGRNVELATTIGHLTALPERPSIVVVDNHGEIPVPPFPDEPRVTVVRAGRNLGAAGRNLGVSLVSSRYVAFCDDDSWWAPGALAEAAEVLDQHPGIGVLVARVLVGPEEREDPICAQLASSPLPRPPNLPGPSVLGFLACGAVVRRQAFLEAGGFDERLGVGGEEDLLALNLASRGWELVYLDRLVAHHHPSSRREVGVRRRGEVRNALWTAWLRRPLGSALAVSVPVVRQAAATPEGRSGLLTALEGMAWVLRERRVVSPVVAARLALLDGT